MVGPACPGSPRRLERGGISWVGLLLIALLAGAGYLGWVWAPLYFQHYAVKQVVRDYMNQAIKNSDDEGLRRNMVFKIRSLEEVEALDRRGARARVPAIALEERQVRWVRDTAARPPTLRVAFEYERQVRYPVIDRVAARVFEVDLTGDLTRAEWAPAR